MPEPFPRNVQLLPPFLDDPADAAETAPYQYLKRRRAQSPNLAVVSLAVDIVSDLILDIATVNLTVAFEVALNFYLRLGVMLQPVPAPSGPTDYGSPDDITVSVT